MLRRTSIAIGAAAVLSLLVAAPAVATFPGANGRIAYTRYDDSTIHTVLPSGHGDEQIRSLHGTSPSWSPNGRQLAFVAIRGDQYQVSLMAADGSHARQLTDPPTDDFSPSFAPGGHRVLFTRGGQITSRLMTIRTDGSDLRTVVRGGGGAAWSPGGREIAFNQEGGIWAIRPNGTNAHELTSNPRDGLSGYSPDGKHITFVRKRDDKKWVTMIARSDGSHIRRLPCLPTPRDKPIAVTYSPDSQWFLGTYPVPGRNDPRITTDTVIRFPVGACMNGTMRQQLIVRQTTGSSISWQPLLSP